MLYEQANSEESGYDYQRQSAMSPVDSLGLDASLAKHGPHPVNAHVGIRPRMKLYLRRTILRFGRSLLTIIRGPIAIERWLVVLFIIAALSTVIIDGISLSTGFSSLQREILVP